MTEYRSSSDLVVGDALEVLRTLPDHSVDAVVTDPPYALPGGFMGREWDHFASSRAFQEWCQAWATECLRVLKPGGHLLAFGGARTYHRLASGVEDAGFEVRDQLLWVYAQGMPKSGGLKPGHEPIVMARKPFGGTRKANVATWGTGALNIDGCRIPARPDETITTHAHGNGPLYGVFGSEETHQTAGQALGRWPSNVILTDSVFDGDYPDDVVGGGMSALGVWGSSNATTNPDNKFCHSKGRAEYRSVASVHETEPAGKSRYFLVPKASRKDRSSSVTGRPVTNQHETVKPEDLMRHLVRLVTPKGGLVLDPFAGSGTTGVACAAEGLRFLGIEREPKYAAIARARLGTEQVAA